MRVSVATRWLDDSIFAQRFILNWEDIADEIIICDGGSQDYSLEILSKHPKVKIVEFHEKIAGLKGGNRNPEGKHVNATIDACDGDWIILTESDAWPTIGLAQHLRHILRDCSYDAVFSWLYYISPLNRNEISSKGPRCYYPELNLGPGMTAWRRSLGIRADDNSLFEPAVQIPEGISILNLPHELHRVHLTYDTEAHIKRKNLFYKNVHNLEFPHPDKRFSKKEVVPEYCLWKDPTTYFDGYVRMYSFEKDYQAKHIANQAILGLDNVRT